MSGVIVLTCNSGGPQCQGLRPIERSTGLPAARVRAALLGWSTWVEHGVTWDVCPVCAAAAAALAASPVPHLVPGQARRAAQLDTDRLVAVLLAEPALAATGEVGSAWPVAAPRHATTLLPEGVELCSACEDGEHRRCQPTSSAGCPCPAVEHGGRR